MRSRSPLPAIGLATVLVTVLALAGCGEQASSTGSPGTPGTPAAVVAATEIPDDFPLASGMGAPTDDLSTSRTGTGLRDLALCGTSPLRGLGLRDRMVADNSGGESANTRELVLLGSPEEPTMVAQAFSDLALACEGADAEGAGSDMETVTEVRESAFGPPPAATLVQTYAFDGQAGNGATIIHVVPVGSALLVSSTYGEWPGTELERGVTETVEALRESVAAMGMFADGTSPSPSASATSLPGPRVVPDGFPLTAGMMEGNADYERQEPSRDAEGTGEVQMCGRVVWPTGRPQDRLTTQVLGPEYYDARELLVFSDSDAALDAMAAVRRAAEECRSSDTQVWTPLEQDTGYDSVTMGLTYAEGLGSSVFQLTRVGSAVLLVTTYGEGSLDSLPDQGADVTDVTTAIAPAMCAFTEVGC